MKKPKSVKAYFAGLADDQRAALQKLRETISSAAPEAEGLVRVSTAHQVGKQAREGELTFLSRHGYRDFKPFGVHKVLGTLDRLRSGAKWGWRHTGRPG